MTRCRTLHWGGEDCLGQRNITYMVLLPGLICFYFQLEIYTNDVDVKIEHKEKS